ncbi:MAG: carboxypeptidase regulatory-like domain-containing protein [Terracidiphilus sp.]
MRSTPLKCVALTAFALVLALADRPVLGQNAQGTILGHVTDPSGAAVSGAKVTVEDLGTDVATTVVTNSSGDYTVPALNPGNYSVTVEAAGFGRQVSGNVVLEVQQSLRQDFSLKVGSVSNTVQVSASSQMLHTEDQTVGQVISGQLIQALPVNGRDFTNLMLTNVGTNITPGGSGVDWGYHGLNQEYMEVSADGAQAQSTSYSVDGVYDADFFFSVPINIPNELSIQEFKMMNGMYGAEYGQGAAQVNVDIKSGTNSLHGAVYWSLEGSWLQPNSPYQEAVNNATGSTSSVNPPFHQNQFGGAFGGPLTIPHIYNGKNRTFWFASYDEGLYSKVNTPSSDWVPTSAELGGDFSAWPFPIYDPSTTVANPAYNSSLPESPTNSPVIRTQFSNNQIPSGDIDKVSANIAKFFDSANNSSCSESQHILTGCYNYSADTQTAKKQGIGTARFDQYLGANDHVYLTGNWGTMSQSNTSIRYGQGGEVYTRPKLFGATWTHTFGATLLNQATLGYSRDHYLNGTNTAYGPNLSSQVGLANTNNNPVTFDLPQLGVFNYQGFGGGEPTTYADNIYQGVDTVTMIRGPHTLNFGIDFRRIQLFELDNYDGTGNLSFNGEFTALVPGFAGDALASGGTYSSTAPYEGNALADFLLGDTSSAGGPPPVATDDYILWGNNWNLFMQDDWHATNRLTLNAGLRWMRPANLHTKNGDGYAFSFANGGQFVWANCSFVNPILAAGGNPNFLQCGASNTLVPIDKKDFAPRLGFAYRPSGMNEKFVVRGGFGIFYGLYNRYYDGSQYDKDSLYNESAASIPSPSGTEAQSTALVKNLWAPPVTSDTLFKTPGWEFPFNQVNWPKNRNPYDEQWSFDTEYSLTPKLMLDVGYVGDHGLHQPSQDILGVATPPTVAGDPCNSTADISLASSACLTDPNFQPIDTREPYPNMPPYLYGNNNGFQSTYNGLQVQLIQREFSGLTYHVNYTYSKTMDLTSGINLINGEPGLIQDPHNPYQEYGLSASDQTHRFVATYAYQVPNNLFHVHDLNWLLTGWTTSGVYQLASGFPFAINGGEPADQMGEYYASRIQANSTYQTSSGFKKTLAENFDTSKYSTPPLGRYGNTNKSPERTPYLTNLDASFGKTTNIWEHQSLMIRAEIFNLGSTWHSTSVGNDYLFPDATVTDSNFGSLVNANYGSVSLFNPRIVQLTAQYSF